MTQEISLKEYKESYRQIVVEAEKKGFLFHVIVYVLINVAFVVINLIYSPESIWFFYPLIGWGIGLSIHCIAIRWIEKELKDREAKAEYRAKEAKTEGSSQK